MNNLLVETYKYNYKGYTVEIRLDNEPVNPRIGWNFGTIVSTHKNYDDWGDKYYNNNTNNWYRNMLCYFKDVYNNDINGEDIESWVNENVIVLPINLVNHEKTTISVKRESSVKMGFIYILMNNEKIDNLRRENDFIKNVSILLQSEVEELNLFYNEQCYYISVYDKDSIPIRTLGNFFGDDFESNGTYKAAENIINEDILKIKDERTYLIGKIKREVASYDNVLIENNKYVYAKLHIIDNELYSNNTNIEKNGINNFDIEFIRDFHTILKRGQSVYEDKKTNTIWNLSFNIV